MSAFWEGFWIGFATGFAVGALWGALMMYIGGYRFHEHLPGRDDDKSD